MKIKLFVNKNFLVPGVSHIELLFPFLGVVFNASDPYTKEIHRYVFDTIYFELVDHVADADYYVFPYDYWFLKNKRPDFLQKMLTEAAENKKPILIDASGDIYGKIDVPNSVIMRLNQYRIDLPPNEITVPFSCEDLLENYCQGELPIRVKPEIPVIGFAGWAGLSLKQRIRTMLKESPHRFLSLFNKEYQVYRKGVFWREKAIRALQKFEMIKTNFILRQSYSGHARTLQGDPQKNRKEFFENLLSSDYSLVVRGDANAAVRFYETLSLGRIPVFVDTACVLPLEDKISYKDFCVFVDFRDIKKIGNIVADFHSKVSPEQFIAMQEKARYIFKNFLRRDAFSKHLAESLAKFLTKATSSKKHHE